jgi:hypothetical protein
MDAKLNEVITAGSTNETQLKFTDRWISDYRQVVTFYIEVITGTVKFGVGAAGAAQDGLTAGEKLILSCYNGELYFDAASGSDTFKVTA